MPSHSNSQSNQRNRGTVKLSEKEEREKKKKQIRGGNIRGVLLLDQVVRSEIGR